MWFRSVLISLLYATALVSAHIQRDTDDVYIAGAVQWTPYGSPNTPAAAVLDQNLGAFATQAQEAANQGVQVLVFDEGSLGMFWPQGLNLRDLTLPYCESFPSPTPGSISFVDDIHIQHFPAQSIINPCQGSGGNFSTTSQIYRLSCIARQAQLILVVNTCDAQTCSSSTDPTCPTDGRYQYNTQVVFNEQGDFIAKYHKSHLFSGDTAFNKPLPVAVTFDSSFGVTFGTFVCFDILYPAPAATLVKMGIKHFIFSSWWLNFPPLFVATQQQQAWSRQHQVAVIAANTGSAPNESGGGIYIAGEPLVSLFKTSGPDSNNVREILVAKIPKTFQTKLQPQPQPHMARDAQPIETHPMDTVACALGSVLGPTGNCTLFSPSQAGATFNLSVISGTISCSAVLTSTTGVNETFGILAYQGQIHFPGATDPLSLEVCGIAQCKNAGVIFGYTVCESLFTASTIFSSFTITGSGFRHDTSLFPYLALSDAQIQDTSFLTVVETNNGTRIAQISNGKKIDQTMFSASLFGIVPNPTSSYITDEIETLADS